MISNHAGDIAAKNAERGTLATLMAAFGGRVQMLSHTERAPYKHIGYNNQSANQARVEAAKKREAAKEKERQIIEHAKALAATGLNTREAGRALRKRWPDACMTEPKLQQMAALHGIAFVARAGK